MPTSSISGLASGLDTAGIVDQLMLLEAASQNRLKSQQSIQKTVLSALQSLNTDVASLATRAEALAKPATWQALTGTSSSTDVTTTLGSNATAASFSITVDRLAASHQLGFTSAVALTDTVVGGAAPTSVRITSHDGSVHDVATGAGTLQELVSAINGATVDTGVSATAVRVADGSYRLLAQSVGTGADSDFTLANTDGTALLGGANVRAGVDAQVSLGLGIVATSSTNTFIDLVPGVSLTLNAAATLGRTTTVSVAKDPLAGRTAAKALVDQLNALLTTIDTKTNATGTANSLAGDANARDLRSALLNSVFGSGTTTMASVGIQTDRYGKLVFDEAAFTKAYQADPAAVAAKFTTGATPDADGWAARLQKVAKAASNSTTGTITSAITGRQGSIDRLGDNIEAWDLRLELRRTTLTRTYTALETALNSLQSQSTWLTSQINALSSSS